MTTDRETIAAALERAGKATGGEWRHTENGWLYTTLGDDPNTCIGKTYHAPSTDKTQVSAMEDNADFIAHTKTDVPELCRIATEAIERAERLAAALGKIANGDGVYGAQSHEYKQIARAALGMKWP